MFTFTFTLEVWQLVVVGLFLYLCVVIRAFELVGREGKSFKMLSFPIVVVFWLPYRIYRFFSGFFRSKKDLDLLIEHAAKHKAHLVKIVPTVYVWISSKPYKIGNMQIVRTLS